MTCGTVVVTLGGERDRTSGVDGTVGDVVADLVASAAGVVEDRPEPGERVERRARRRARSYSACGLGRVRPARRASARAGRRRASVSRVVGPVLPRDPRIARWTAERTTQGELASPGDGVPGIAGDDERVGGLDRSCTARTAALAARTGSHRRRSASTTARRCRPPPLASSCLGARQARCVERVEHVAEGDDGQDPRRRARRTTRTGSR